SECSFATIETASLPQPLIVSPGPIYGTVFDYRTPHASQLPDAPPLQFIVRGYGRPARFHMRFLERQADGSCGRTALEFDYAMPSCSDANRPDYSATACTATITDDLFPAPWPGGYCMEATAFSHEEDKPSETART